MSASYAELHRVLRNVERHRREARSQTARYRAYGAAEVLLQLLGLIDPSKDFPYRKIKEKGLLWGSRIREESYGEFISRLTAEALEKYDHGTR